MPVSPIVAGEKKHEAADLKKASFSRSKASFNGDRPLRKDACYQEVKKK
jgi:hypothetical protein